MKTLLFITAILVYLTCISAKNSTKLNCNNIEGKTPYYQLRRYLFCDYDPTVGPKNDSMKGIITDLSVLPRLVIYNDWDNSLELHLWMSISWNNHHLIWPRGNYHGIDYVHVKSHEIWTPGIYASNSNYGNIDLLPDSDCDIYSNGGVLCITEMSYKASCISDYKYWPYNEHNCTLKLGSWAHSTEEVVFGNNSVHISMNSFLGNPEWRVGPGNIEIILRNENLLIHQIFQSVAVHISMIRAHSSLTSVILSPVIILTIVTLETLWLKPGSTERLILSCVNVLGHILTIKNIRWIIPHTGNVLPNIMIFYHNSFILAVIAMILTCWLQGLSDWKRQVPPWLSEKIAVILASKPGQMLLMNFSDPSQSALLEEDVDDNSSLVNSDSKESKWHYVVIVIGWISFFAFSIIYLVLFAVFLRFPSLESSGIKYY